MMLLMVRAIPFLRYLAWMWVVVMLLLVCLAWSVFAQTGIVGQYACTGQTPAGKSYDVDLAIEQQGDGYTLTWTDKGEPVAYGVGILKSGVLSVIFQTPNAIGLSAYAVTKNGLDGTWTVPGLDGVLLPEKCTVGKGPAKAA